MKIHFYVTPAIIAEAREKYKVEFEVSPTSVAIEKVLWPGAVCKPILENYVRIDFSSECPHCQAITNHSEKIWLNDALRAIEINFLTFKPIEPYHFSLDIPDWAIKDDWESFVTIADIPELKDIELPLKGPELDGRIIEQIFQKVKVATDGDTRAEVVDVGGMQGMGGADVSDPSAGSAT